MGFEFRRKEKTVGSRLLPVPIVFFLPCTGLIGFGGELQRIVSRQKKRKGRGGDKRGTAPGAFIMGCHGASNNRPMSSAPVAVVGARPHCQRPARRWLDPPPSCFFFDFSFSRRHSFRWIFFLAGVLSASHCAYWFVDLFRRRSRETRPAAGHFDFDLRSEWKRPCCPLEQLELVFSVKKYSGT